MTQRSTCPECGTPHPVDAPPGVCPSCSLLAALEAQLGDPQDADQGGGVARGADPPGLSPWSSSPGPLRFGDYELLEEIARGGMGIVYRARQLGLDRAVAVKLLPFSALTSAPYIRRFRAEASAAAALRHPNIVTIHEVGVLHGQHYLVMNFVNGPSLDRLVNGGPLPARRAATYAKAIAGAVHYAHEKGILHRDLKPSNVLVDEEDQPQVTDFGLAKRLDHDSRLTLTGQALGSPGYMPPEQALAEHGKVTRRSDVYGLGAILYHLLTGRPPFQADTVQQALQQVMDREPPPPRLLNPGLPRDLETVCLKCLEKEPERRYPSAQAVEEELGRFLKGEPVQARPPGTAEKAWRWCRRRPLLAGMAAALALTLAVGLAGIVWQWRRSLDAEWVALQNAYAADIRQAQISLEAGDLGTALELLNKYRPERWRQRSFGSRDPSDLRGWEWRYLWQLCQGDENETLHRYPSWVGGLAVSPDGSLLAVQTGEGRVVLWDLAGRREIGQVEASGKRGTVAISPDGKLLAAADWQGSSGASVVLWDLPGLQLSARLPQKAPVMSLAFSPDGKVLATQESDEAVTAWDLESHQTAWALDGLPDSNVGDVSMTKQHPSANVLRFSPALDTPRLACQHVFDGVRIVDWNDGSGRQVLEPPSEENPIGGPLMRQLTAVAFSPVGNTLALGSADGTIRLSTLSGNPETAELTGHRNAVLALLFTPDGKRLVSASSDQSIHVWEMATRTTVTTLRGHENEVLALALLPDGHTLVSGSRDGTARLWDLDAPSPDRQPVSVPVIQARFTPDGRHFVGLEVPDEYVALWESRSGRKVENLPEFGGPNYVIDLSRDGKWFAASGWKDPTIRVWDWTTRQEVAQFPIPATARLVGFTPGGRYLGTRYPIEGHSETGGNALEGRSWRTGSWEPITEDHFKGVDRDGSMVSSVCVTRDDTVWARGKENGEIEIRSLPDGRLLRTLTGSRSRVEALDFSPDGRWLAAAGREEFVRIWDMQTAKVSRTLRSHFTHTYGVRFSEAGSRLAIGGVGGGAPELRIRIWDLATGRELLTLLGAARHLGFSPDGSILAGQVPGDRVTLFWRAPSWEEIEAKERSADGR